MLSLFVCLLVTLISVTDCTRKVTALQATFLAFVLTRAQDGELVGSACGIFAAIGVVSFLFALPRGFLG